MRTISQGKGEICNDARCQELGRSSAISEKVKMFVDQKEK